MKNLFFLSLLLIGTTLPLHGQSWFQNHPNWTNRFSAGWQGDGYEYVTVSGDTVLQGQPAIVLQRLHIMEFSADFIDIRIARQHGDTVWVWNPGKNNFYIQYNFSLTVGDSVVGPLGWGNNQFRYYIDSVGTVLIDGQSLRFQKVHFYRSDDLYKCPALAIERLGFVQGSCAPNPLVFHYPMGTHLLVDESNEGAVDGPNWTVCQYQNDQLLYQQAAFGCSALNAQQAPAGSSSFRVQPNPLRDAFSVVAGQEQTAGKLRVFNTAGQLVLQTSAPFETVSVATWPAGLYLFEITSRTGQRQFCKAFKN